MPNIQTKTLSLHPLPSTFGEYRFEFVAEAPNGRESLIFTRYKDKAFFLILIKRKNDYLIKADKLSRVAPIYIVKDGLKAFRDLHGLETTFSNIEGKAPLEHIQKSDRYLKDISYFIEEFQTDKEIWIEIGFGSGRHLLHQAKKHPDIQMIGLEIHAPSIEQVAKQCKIQGIENILMCKFDARIFLEFLPSNSVGRIFVHFPVPWDKKPHRRVISKSFVQESLRLLKKGGTLELRTDSENYYLYALETFTALNRLDLHLRKNQEIEVSSKYEDRWKRQEKNIYDFILTNEEISEPKPKCDRLVFEGWVPFGEVKARLDRRLIRGEDYFVHFEQCYDIDEERGVIKLSFGAYERCEHKYLIFNNNKIQYFPYESLPIAQNSKSHQKIKELIYGKYD